MSLKENMNYIKQEISSEEKFFESFFKVEKFWKKYKLIIIVLIASIIAYYSFINISSYIKEQNNIEANIAYNKLINNSSDKKSMDILKQKNKILLELAIYKNSKDTTLSNNIIYLKQISMFNKAIKENDLKVIESLIIDPNFVLRDYAIFNKALILSNNKNYNKAKETLQLIPDNSSVKSLSNLLAHYLLTK